MTDPQTTKLTPIEQAMMWERMSGERLSDDERQRIMDGGEFSPPASQTTNLATVEMPVLQPGERIEIHATKEGHQDGDWIEWVLWGRSDVFQGLSGTMALAVEALTDALKQDRAALPISSAFLLEKKRAERKRNDQNHQRA